MMKFQENAEVLALRSSGPFTELVLKAPKISALALPGQFVNIRVSSGLDPLLRRPVSIHDSENGTLSLLVQPVGKGSRYLCSLKIGDFVNLIGPLGNAFPKTDQKILQIAGGVGIAPFRFLAKKNPDSILLFGARSKSFLPEFSSFGSCDIHVATDDGSFGTKGNVLTLLENFDLNRMTIFACGPTPMLRALQEFFYRGKAEFDAWFSLETYMACGFGACKGCAVEMTDGTYQLCCTDGPIFKWNTIKI